MYWKVSETIDENGDREIRYEFFHVPKNLREAGIKYALVDSEEDFFIFYEDYKKRVRE